MIVVEQAMQLIQACVDVLSSSEWPSLTGVEQVIQLIQACLDVLSSKGRI